MRLSEDPRFIEHVKKQLAAYRRRYNLASREASKRGLRLKRSAWERLGEQGLTKPNAFAREFEYCISKRSDLPGTLRMLVNSIGSTALTAFAHELAMENEAGLSQQSAGLNREGR